MCFLQVKKFELEMHNIGFFPDIQYADILQLIWWIIDRDTSTCIYILPTPNCRAHQVSPVVEF